jgi:hypothetical protein
MHLYPQLNEAFDERRGESCSNLLEPSPALEGQRLEAFARAKIFPLQFPLSLEFAIGHANSQCRLQSLLFSEYVSGGQILILFLK